MSAEQRQFEVEGGAGLPLRGARDGEGAPIVLVHGLTAHRDLVVHGSKSLLRSGYELIRYDARGHGQSAGTGEGTYDYEALAADLGLVIEHELDPEAKIVAVGHSMGAHTIVRRVLDAPRRFAALVLIGPVATGERPSDRVLAHWDSLSDGLREQGIEGFLRALERSGIDPDWHDLVLRVAEQRLRKHRDLGAVAQALHELPRSEPIDSLADLASIELPTLVVASHDDSDPGHPYATAQAYTEALPDAELISENEGESPLAWQGGKLSREIASFCERRGFQGGR